MSENVQENQLFRVAVCVYMGVGIFFHSIGKSANIYFLSERSDDNQPEAPEFPHCEAKSHTLRLPHLLVAKTLIVRLQVTI